MHETVLYYTPAVTRQSRILKGILVRMGVRIRNVSPNQTNLTVGELVGLPGYEADMHKESMNHLEVAPCNENKTQIAGAQSCDNDKSIQAAETETQNIPEEVLVLHQFSEPRLDALLSALRKENVRIALKAIVTDQNCSWTFSQLYEELKLEHQKMHQL